MKKSLLLIPAALSLALATSCGIGGGNNNANNTQTSYTSEAENQDIYYIQQFADLMGISNIEMRNYYAISARDSEGYQNDYLAVPAGGDNDFYVICDRLDGTSILEHQFYKFHWQADGNGSVQIVDELPIKDGLTGWDFVDELAYYSALQNLNETNNQAYLDSKIQDFEWRVGGYGEYVDLILSNTQVRGLECSIIWDGDGFKKYWGNTDLMYDDNFAGIFLNKPLPNFSDMRYYSFQKQGDNKYMLKWNDDDVAEITLNGDLVQNIKVVNDRYVWGASHHEITYIPKDQMLSYKVYKALGKDFFTTYIFDKSDLQKACKNKDFERIINEQAVMLFPVNEDDNWGRMLQVYKYNDGDYLVYSCITEALIGQEPHYKYNWYRYSESSNKLTEISNPLESLKPYQQAIEQGVEMKIDVRYDGYKVEVLKTGASEDPDGENLIMELEWNGEEFYEAYG